MISLIYKLIPPQFKEIVKRKSGVPNIYFSIERLKNIGFQPKHIIDVGAYEGEWTDKCASIFPYAKFMMVEAMQSKEDKLNRIASKHKNVEVVLELLGAKSGEEVLFAEIETASSVLEEKASVHIRKKRVTSCLNDIVKSRKIDKVDFLKLDVQGYELEVLRGFDEYLQSTDVILSEISLLDIHKDVPLINDVLNFMYQYKFVTYDICSVDTRRPLDNALWQTDLLFVKEDSIFRSDKRYQK